MSMTLKRIRTLPEAVRMVKELDPETAFTAHYIRKIVPLLPGSLKRGRGWLLDFDELLLYLNDPNRSEKERLMEYEKAIGSIRPVPENLRG